VHKESNNKKAKGPCEDFECRRNIIGLFSNFKKGNEPKGGAARSKGITKTPIM
jgi:hypothetical protein